MRNLQKNDFIIISIASIITIVSIGFFINQSFAQTATVPDAPTGFSAVPVSPVSVSLNWSPPQNNGGAPITGYRIDYRIAPSSTYSTLVTLGNLTTYTHSGLTTAKTYIYRVYAINSIGTGSGTPEQPATPTTSSAPPKPIAPNPPQNLVASIYSSTQINLSWSTPTSNGGPQVTGYRIDYKLDSATAYTNIVANSGNTLTTYSHTGLQVGHVYTYEVYAINSIGTGNASNTASATPTQIITVPGSPTLSATPLSATSISLSWTPPSSDGGSAITGYKIEYANGTSAYTILVSNTGNIQTSYIHSGLATGASYTYRVTAINSIGAGNPSNAVTTQPQDTKTAVIISAVAASPTSVIISWIPPSQTYGQMISGYTVDQVINGNYLSIDDTSSTVTSYTIPNLTTNKTYTFSVTAILSGGSQTNPSPPVSVMPTKTSTASGSNQTPPPPAPQQNQALPDPPSGINATLVSANTVQISWIIPSNNGKLPITGFKIESMTGASGTWSTVASNTGVQTSFIKSGLQAGTIYYYRVSSINNVGTSQPSSEVFVTTQQAANPTPIPPPPPVLQHSQGMIPVYNTTSTIAYEITGGQISGIGVNPGTFSLNINLKDNNPGTISVTIPRDMVDSKKQDGTDDTFIVTRDGTISEFNETKTGTYRTLSISFPANTDKISIYGTTAVPEFPIALIAFLISFIPVIMLSKRIQGIKPIN